MDFPLIRKIEFVSFLLTFIIFCIGVSYSYIDLYYFQQVYLGEDGFLEWTEVLIFITIAILNLRRGYFHFKLNREIKLIFLFFTALFFFGAGEEISWGQRIFDFTIPNQIKTHNIYSQFNLHGIHIFGIKLHSLIFSDLLTLVLIAHLAISPILYKYSLYFKKIIQKMLIPIPRFYHSLYYAVIFFGTMFFVSDKSNEEGELIEFVGSCIYLFIFLNPINTEIFHDFFPNKDPKVQNPNENQSL